MKSKHYKDVYLIEDEMKIDKLCDLFNLSVTNDISKWTQKQSTRGLGDEILDLIIYYSPKYNNIMYFILEFAYDINHKLTYAMTYIYEKTPIIAGQEMQIFSDWYSYSNPNKKIRASIDLIREKVFDANIIELETALTSNPKIVRKNKLEQINIETYKNIIEESFNDFKENPTKAFAREIARTAYGYSLNHYLPYSEWIEKFKDYSIVINEIKKLDNYEV